MMKCQDVMTQNPACCLMSDPVALAVTPACEIMSTNPIPCLPEDDVNDALDLKRS